MKLRKNVMQATIKMLVAAWVAFSFAPNGSAATCCGGQEISLPLACCNHQAYEPADDKKCCNNLGTYDPSLREGKFAVGGEASDFVKFKMEQAFQSIPGVRRIEISEAKLLFVKTVADCCPSEGPPVKDGSKGAQGSLELGAEIEDAVIFPIGGVSSRERREKIFGVSVHIIVNIGAFFSCDIKTTVDLGYLDNTCLDKTCLTSRIALTNNSAVDLRFEAIFCEQWLWFDERCAEVNIVPLKIELSLGVNGTYDNCNGGWQGRIAVGPVSFKSEMRVGGGAFSITWGTWDGYFN